MSETPDVSKIVSLIMQNPSLIEQISNLAKEEGAIPEEEAKEVAQEPTIPEPKAEPTNAAEASVEPKRLHRARLLEAMKPYLSESRSHAIDSMISIVDILEMMNKR